MLILGLPLQILVDSQFSVYLYSFLSTRTTIDNRERYQSSNKRRITKFKSYSNFGFLINQITSQNIS